MTINLIENDTGKKLKQMPNRIPIDGTFELTVRCNLHCKMCLFRHDDSEYPSMIDKELTTKQWIDIADQVAKAGTLSLLITGGEPLLRKDFCEIWKEIYKKGFLITLYTNATLVNDEIMDTFKKYPPNKIGVTIYGSNSEIYEKECGNKNAFDNAIKGIHRLQKLPSKLEFRTTIIKDNYDDLDNMCDLIAEEFGKKYKLIQTRIVTQSVRGACTDVKNCRLSPEDNVKLAFHRGIKVIRNFIGDSFDENNLVFETKEISNDNVFRPRISLFGCDAGMRSYTVSWDGYLLACQMMGNFHENIIEKGFIKAWKDFPKNIKLPPINKKCLYCNDQSLCNSCCASRYAETGDLGGCPEYVCQDTKIIKKILKKEKI